MEVIAIISQLDTHAAARMITLGTIAIVSITYIMYILKPYFSNLLRLTNSDVIGVK